MKRGKKIWAKEKGKKEKRIELTKKNRRGVRFSG